MPKGKRKIDRNVMEEQVKEQMEILNGTNPKVLQSNRAVVEKLREQKKGLGSLRDRAAQKEARDDLLEEAVKALRKKEPNLSQKAAEKLLDATHAVDIIAGGDASNISGLGDSTANRSIGSQWPKGDKLKQLDSAIDKAVKSGQPMNVHMHVCP